ncbi:MAG TPA: nuclear transport factor 2 family protein [Vicinamibacterales bacterium]|jgi:uncharacterized protein (TIGR02246 family)
MAWLTLLTLIACGSAAVSTQTDDAGTIGRLEAEWNSAHVRGDGTALAALFADDLVVVVPGMRPMARNDSLSVFSSGRMKFERYETSDTTVRVYAQSAVVTGRLVRTRRMGDRAIDDDWRFTKVYVREGRGWQVVSFHASVVEP